MKASVALTSKTLTPKKRRQLRKGRRLMYCSIFYRVDHFVFAHIASFLELRDQFCLRRLNIQLNNKLTAKNIFDSVIRNNVRKIECNIENRLRDVLFPFRLRRAIKIICSCLERKLGRSFNFSWKTHKLIKQIGAKSNDIGSYRLKLRVPAHLEILSFLVDDHYGYHDLASIKSRYKTITGKIRWINSRVLYQKERIQRQEILDFGVLHENLSMNLPNLSAPRKATVQDVFGKGEVLATRHSKYHRG